MRYLARRTIAAAVAVAGGLSVLVGAGSLNIHIGTPSEACAFPTCFPDATNTGVPAGTSLTAYTGPSTITADDTVIDSKTIGCITINAANVTIRKSLIECASGNAVQIDDDGNPAGGRSVTIEDSEIDCTANAGQSGISEADYTLTRVEVRSCENGCDANRDITIQDSWLHALDNGAADPHEDGCQLAAGHFEGAALVDGTKNVTFTHNTIDGHNKDNSIGTSAIISNPGAGLDVNTLIQNNHLISGGTTLYCPRPGQGTNYRILSNSFTPSINLDDDCADETHSGNIYQATGLPADPDFSG